MSAGYFDGRAHPGQSLLRLGARLGYTVLAPDRPGYGASADALPEGQCLAEQADSLHAALDDFVRRHDTGAGLFLLAHSYGGKLALAAAARDDGRVPRDAGRGLLGLDISGLGHRYAVLPEELPNERGHGHWTRTWGKLRLYPPGTFRGSGALVAPMPVREREEALRWPETFASLAARVRVPVRLTFAEHRRGGGTMTTPSPHSARSSAGHRGWWSTGCPVPGTTSASAGPPARTICARSASWRSASPCASAPRPGTDVRCPP
jgi:pimeloyl-ACP methyl ester carboxylesterase